MKIPQVDVDYENSVWAAAYGQEICQGQGRPKSRATPHPQWDHLGGDEKANHTDREEKGAGNARSNNS